MYNLTQEQITEVKTFIGKLPDSMVKSHYEKWLAEVEPTERVTSEQLEKFLSFQNSLPKELQSFPQSFAGWLKNEGNTVKREQHEGTAQPAELGSLVADSISDVPDVSAPDNKEETLHKLATKGTKGAKGSEKADTSKKKELANQK